MKQEQQLKTMHVETKMALYGAWLCMAHGSIWRMALYGSWLYVAHGSVWLMALCGAWLSIVGAGSRLYMAHGSWLMAFSFSAAANGNTLIVSNLC